MEEFFGDRRAAGEEREGERGKSELVAVPGVYKWEEMECGERGSLP
jgi:hypothetical protein